jgi:hypothetical protein
VHAAEGSVFVGPSEFLVGAREIVSRGLVKAILVEALAEAADDDGVLADFNNRQFFETHVARALADPYADETIVPVAYDRFSAMALTDYLTSLMIEDGLLANRGKGDSYDLRLTLPSDTSRR